MLDSWLNFIDRSSSKYSFRLFEISEKSNIDASIIYLLKEKILFSYRSLDLIKFYLGDTISEEEIRKYVNNYIIPGEDNQFDRNVRQGDWGEVLSALIVSYIQNLDIPLNKLQWKFNKDKAVFGTDLVAFNQGDTINDIYYYEVKTRLHPDIKEGQKDKYYISIWAHNSLLKDMKSPTESIADFCLRLFLEKKDFEKAEKFKDIIKNPQKYNKKFEIFLIVEKAKFLEDLLTDLDELPPELNPLTVTIILISDLKKLVEETWKDIESVLLDKLIHEYHE